MNQLVLENKERQMMELYGKKVKLKFNREELKTFDYILKYWLSQHSMTDADLWEKAQAQIVIRLIESKLRPFVIALKPQATLKIDLMQAYVLLEILESYCFVDSSWEWNAITRILNQIDKQTV